MKRLVSGLTLSAFVLAAAPISLKAEQKKGLLDGKSFNVELVEPGKPASNDRLIFKDGQFDSTACRAYGFKKAAYTTGETTEPIAFESVATSPKEGVNTWKGTVKGNRIEGTLTWQKKKGGKPVVYTFSGMQMPSLYDRLGGVYNIAVLIDEFIERLLINEVLNANPAVADARSRVPKAGLKFRVTQLVSQATGGPDQYAGRSMKESHKLLNITEKEWDAMLKDFQAVLDKYHVQKAEQEELLEIVASTKADIVTKVAGGK